DVTHPSLTASTTVTVVAAAATSLGVAAPASAIAGTPITVIVTAYDSYGNVDTGFFEIAHSWSNDTLAVLPPDAPLHGGTGRFTSSDPRATPPPDYTFMAGDQGRHLFVMTFGTLGNQSLTAMDTRNPSITGTATAQVTPVSTTTSVSAGVNPVGLGQDPM